MVTQWERFERRTTQSLRDLGGEQAIELTNGTGGYNGPGDSGNTSYPSTPDATLDAETAAPSAVSGVEQAGTFEGIDQLAWVPSNYTDQTYTADTTIASGEVETFDVVTIEAGVTLTVNGTLQANEIITNGTLENNGTVTVFNTLANFIVPYGNPDQPPTRVKVLENDETFEVQSTTQSGDGYLRLDMTEL